MAVTFRSADLPSDDRKDATHSAFLNKIWPTTVELDDPAAEDSVLEVWNFGQTTIFSAHLTGMHLHRSAHQVRTGPSEMLTVARQTRSVGRHEQFGVQHVVEPGELMLVDMNEPYDFFWEGRGNSHALYLPLAELGLTREVIAVAAPRLPASPLYALICAHIADMAAAGDALADSPAAQQLGTATVDLARALIASAYDTRYATGMLAEMLLPRIRGYIRQHLSDVDLSPEQIARAHDISVRKLFRVCEEADISLEQWIITQRLEGAHEELLRPETGHVPIAAVARRWGFDNASYFSRRFRLLYGLTPRACRALATAGDHR